MSWKELCILSLWSQLCHLSSKRENTELWKALKRALYCLFLWKALKRALYCLSLRAFQRQLSSLFKRGNTVLSLFEKSFSGTIFSELFRDNCHLQCCAYIRVWICMYRVVLWVCTYIVLLCSLWWHLSSSKRENTELLSKRENTELLSSMIPIKTRAQELCILSLWTLCGSQRPTHTEIP